MYRILFTFSLVLLLTACSNNCQSLIDDITTAKNNYEASPTASNCTSYETALQAYLSSSCQSPQGVNYDAIFQNFLSGLSCSTLPTNVPTCSDGVQNGNETGLDCGGPDCSPCSSVGTTCTDGIQNGNETGVDCGGPDCSPCATTGATCTDGIQNGNETGIDCGGTCPPCSSTNNYYMTCEIDGVAWNAFSGGFFPLAVNSNGVINAYINFLNEGQIRISNFDDFLVTGSYVFSTAGEGALSAGEASFSYSPEAAGTISLHYYEPAGDNGSLIVTNVDLVNSTVTGTFSLSAYDNNFMPYDTISVTNGEFFLPMQ